MGVLGSTARMLVSALPALAFRFCSFLAVASAMSATSVTVSDARGKGDLISLLRVNSCKAERRKLMRERPRKSPRVGFMFTCECSFPHIFGIERIC